MHALPRRRGADGLRGEAIGRPKTRGPRSVMKPAGALVFPSKPSAAALGGKPGQTPVAFEPCGVFRPHAGRLGLAWFSRVGMAGLEPAASRPPAARATTGPSGRDGPSHRFFQCMMRVCPHGCLVRRATGGTVWWSRRDSDPRPSRCERDALPLRHGPMPVLPYAGRADWKRSHSGGGVTPLVPPAGLGPATPTLGGWRSIP